MADVDRESRRRTFLSVVLGTLFLLPKFLVAQHYTVLKQFTGADGASPRASLTLSGDTLYGTTRNGGSSGLGTVFKLSTNGTGHTMLKHFAGSDGSEPWGSLLLSGGVLYGTTFSGGASGLGTVFKVNTDGTSFTVLRNFTGSDGSRLLAGLVLSGSTLYGTTQMGGSSNSGTVFTMNNDGTGFSVLKHFGGSDGIYPALGNLVLSGGVLYGTTEWGGSYGDGTVFRLNTNGTGFTVLKHLTGTNGAWPRSGLILAENTLYGATFWGGNTGAGTVFKIDTGGGGFTVIKHFNYDDGSAPYGALTIWGNMLYGTTRWGGGENGGTIFKLNTDGSAFTVLKHMAPENGVEPYAGLTMSGKTMYGTASAGGDQDGVVFARALAPKLNAISNFTVNPGQAIAFPATTTPTVPISQSVSFSLVSPPAGATISGAGLFHWRPSLAQAGTVNELTILASDNDTPPLSSTISFQVNVNSLTSVALGQGSKEGAGFKFGVSGAAGPDYVLLASSNLIHWTDIATNESPVMPFEFTDTSLLARNRYYRARVEAEHFGVLSINIITNPEPVLSRYFGIGLTGLGDSIVAGRYPIPGGVGTPTTNVSALRYSGDGALLTALTNPVALGNGDNEHFGTVLAKLGNDRIIASGRDASGKKVVYLFSTNGALLNTITNLEASSSFGNAVAGLGTDRVLVGDVFEIAGRLPTFYGKVDIFDTNGTLITTITNPTAGHNLSGPLIQDSPARPLAAVGEDKILVGNFLADIGATDSGEAYLFNTNGALLTSFTNPAPSYLSGFGYSVAAVGQDRVLIGAYRNSDQKTNGGAAYLLGLDGSLLATFKSPASQTNDGFGRMVAALGENRILIGGYDILSGHAYGAVYVFNTNGTLLTVLTDTRPNAPYGQAFAKSIATVGTDRVAVGAPTVSYDVLGGFVSFPEGTVHVYQLGILNPP